MKWYYIDYAELAGAENMALDAYLLANPPDAPLFKLFGWEPSAVSLGFNQKLEEFDSDFLNCESIDIVRRPTGGRAVFHHNEITYTVVIPDRHELYTLSLHDLYYTISDALTAGLLAAGIDASIEYNKPNSFKKDHIKCFASTARFEVKVGQRKIIGSAQRRMTQAILQHGSLILTDHQDVLEKIFPHSTKAAEKRSENILSGSQVPIEVVRESIEVNFQKKMNCSFVPYPDLEMAMETVAQTTLEYALFECSKHKEIV